MPWRTVLDNVTAGAGDAAGSAPARRARAGRATSSPASASPASSDRWPASLSGGMRQRAALLRTFLAGREVMLLDEPFGALDALTRQADAGVAAGLWQADRKTILFVTHDVEEAVYLSDRVYVMSGRPGRMQPVRRHRPAAPTHTGDRSPPPVRRAQGAAAAPAAGVLAPPAGGLTA